MENIDELLAYIKQLSASDIDVKTPQVPPILILTGSELKEGLSAREVAKRIILSQNEAGAPIGQLPTGEDSISEKMEYIRVREIFEHLITNAIFQVVIPAGVPVQAYGVGADGVPVTVNGVTTTPAIGYAIIK
jgi:hypothetical protein